MSEENYNLKEREVYCPECHIYSTSRELQKRCYNCSSILITVIYSAISGKRITGAHRSENV